MEQIKIAICQPLIPKYRRAFFEGLSKNASYEIDIYSGKSKGSLQAIEGGVYYKHIVSPVKEFKLFNKFVKWQSSQIAIAFKKKYDLIILPWDAGFITMWFSLVLGKLFNVPIILWGHGFSKKPTKLSSLVRNTAGNLSSAIILYDEKTKHKLRMAKTLKNRNVFVAPNALPYDEVSEAKKYWDQNKLNIFKKENNIHNKFNIIFVSRLEKENRIDLLIECLNLVNKARDDIQLIIVGDGSEKQNLLEITKALNLNNITFTGAIYSEKELCPWMLSSILFCYPLNIGLSINHAYQYSLPVVTSDDIAGHNPEICSFVNNENGLLYKDLDINDMARCWLELVENPDKRQMMSNNAFLTSKKYSIDNMILGFQEAIEHCLSA